MKQPANMATLAILGFLIAACTGQDVYVSTLGGNGGGAGSGGAGAADGGNGCPGECVPLAPLGWSEATLLWIGSSPLSAPECPERAPVVGYCCRSSWLMGGQTDWLMAIGHVPGSGHEGRWPSPARVTIVAA